MGWKWSLSFISHLEQLFITDCSELMELPFSHPTCCQAQREDKMVWFPRLWNIVIRDCPKLASFPPIPWRTHAPCSGQIKRAGSGIESLAYPAHGSKEGLEIEGTGGQGDLLWNGLNFSNLTYLKELCVRKCPPLPLYELQLLVSLKKIKIYYSSSVLPPVQCAGHGMYRFPVEDLSIIRCDTSGEQLTLLLSFLPNLSHLVIETCNNIIGLGVAEHVETVSGEQQQHTTRGDEEIASSTGLLLLPPHLQELRISDCNRIRLLSKPPHDDQAAGEERGGGVQRLRSLHFLDVGGCPEFLSSYSSPSSSFFPFPTCQQQLTLFWVNHMETLQVLSNLTSLTQLTLIGLEGSRDEGLWPLLAHGSITKLILYYIPDFFAGSNPSWPLDKEVSSHSSKLLDLSTSHNTRFLAAPICSLFSSTLARLVLRFENKVEPLTKEQEEALQLLTSLEELRFMWGDKLQRLPTCLDKLINLKKLEIHGCWSIQSLPSLPSSLQELEIFDCRALKSLPSGLPSSLEILNISDCNGIKSLPKDGLPSSVRELDVHDGNSEELKRACRKLIGTIPIVRV